MDFQFLIVVRGRVEVQTDLGRDFILGSRIFAAHSVRACLSPRHELVLSVVPSRDDFFDHALSVLTRGTSAKAIQTGPKVAQKMGPHSPSKNRPEKVKANSSSNLKYNNEC